MEQKHAGMTPRRWFGWVLAGATAVSLAGNVAAALLVPHSGIMLPAWVVIAVAAVAPLALPVAVHSVPVAARASGAVRAVTVAAVAIVATAAFALSFDALTALAAAAGHHGWIGWLLPITVDVLAAASAVALVADHPGQQAATNLATGGRNAATDPATAPVPAPVTAPVAAAGGHPVAGGVAGGRDEVAGPVAGGHLVAVSPLTSDDEPEDAHRARAEELVAAGVVRADPATVATALAGLATGDSHRAIAAATGLHRVTVSRLAEVV